MLASSVGWAGTAGATTPPTGYCPYELPSAGGPVAYGGVDTILTICIKKTVGPGSGYGSGSWATVWIYPNGDTTSVAAQTCAIAIQPYTAVCIGTGNVVYEGSHPISTTTTENRVTLYPARVCVWEPLDSPSGGTFCNWQRVDVVVDTSRDQYPFDVWLITVHNAYVSVCLAPVPSSNPGCLININKCVGVFGCP